jgi:O-antigen/teichoic acid export membrane protein
MAATKLLALVVVARVGGTIQVAGLSSFLASVVLFSVVASGGLNLTLVTWRERSAAEDQSIESTLASAYGQLQLLAIPTMILAFIATWSVARSSPIFALLAALSVPLYGYLLTLGALVFADENYRLHAIGQSIGQLLFALILIVGAIVWPSSIGLIAAAGWLIGSIATVSLWKHLLELPRVGPRSRHARPVWPILKSNSRALTWNISAALTIRADFYAVGLLLSEHQLGLYALLRAAIDFLLYGANIYSPIVMRSAASSIGDANAKIRRFLTSFFIASVFLGPLSAIFVPYIIGASYREIRWHFATVGIVAVAQGAVLLSASKHLGSLSDSKAAALGVSSAISTGVISLLLIPAFHISGAIAAAALGSVLPLLFINGTARVRAYE